MDGVTEDDRSVRVLLHEPAERDTSLSVWCRAREGRSQLVLKYRPTMMTLLGKSDSGIAVVARNILFEAERIYADLQDMQALFPPNVPLKIEVKREPDVEDHAIGKVQLSRQDSEANQPVRHAILIDRNKVPGSALMGSTLPTPPWLTGR